METAKHHGNVTFAVNLQHALIWVARALDYVGIDDLHHNQRVAYIVYESAKALGWTQSQQEFCFSLVYCTTVAYRKLKNMRN